MSVTYLSLGSNLGNKRRNLLCASALIAERAGDILALSAIRETEPWGFESANTFLNLAIKLETALLPADLLCATQAIEIELGRTQKSDGTYHDRTIDIDILLYDNLVIETPTLIIPHPFMHKRFFVLEPLAEIAPRTVHPVLNKTIKELLACI